MVELYIIIISIIIICFLSCVLFCFFTISKFLIPSPKNQITNIPIISKHIEKKADKGFRMRGKIDIYGYVSDLSILEKIRNKLIENNINIIIEPWTFTENVDIKVNYRIINPNYQFELAKATSYLIKFIFLITFPINFTIKESNTINSIVSTYIINNDIEQYLKIIKNELV